MHACIYTCKEFATVERVFGGFDRLYREVHRGKREVFTYIARFHSARHHFCKLLLTFIAWLGKSTFYQTDYNCFGPYIPSGEQKNVNARFLSGRWSGF